MKLVILAGGQKSTVTGEEVGIPKPMLEIGGRPLLWHIMKHASQYGINEFIVCGGYRIESIKEYFRDFYMYQSDIMINTRTNQITVLKEYSENWSVIIADTGLKTSPVERVKLIKKYVDNAPFIVMYGDCLTDINFDEFIGDYKKDNYKLGVSLARPTGRKAPINIEKSNGEKQYWTSAGVFIVSSEILDETDTLEDLEELISTIDRSEMLFYKHFGYFNTVETLRDKVAAEKMWEKGEAPWI